MFNSVTSQYYCDFCGMAADPKILHRLRDERVLSYDKNHRSAAADVCSDCQNQPVSELLKVIEWKRQAKAGGES